MTIRKRRGLVGLLAVTALAATSFTGTAPSGAQETPDPVVEGGHDLTPAPGYEQYDGCPLLNTQSLALCLAVTINGDIQLGKVGGAIEDLKMVLGVDASIGGEPAIVPAQGGGGPSSIPMPGGLLGIPGLEPILQLDVLDLLTLGAVPHLGELQQTGLDGVIGLAALGFGPGFPTIGQSLTAEDEPVALPAPGENICVFGGTTCVPWPEIQLGLPLNVQLKNTLLGPQCKIGPVDLAMTTGTTSPPAGVAPLTGSSGSLTRNSIFGPNVPTYSGIDFHIDGLELVGNEFAVPGSTCPGILNLGRNVGRLGKLLGVPTVVRNPFEQVIDGQAGIPTPAGRSSAELTIDLHVAQQSLVYPDLMDLSPSSVDFGDVAVGSSATETITLTNTRNSARTFSVSNPTGTIFQHTSIENNTCNTVLPAGASCTFDLQFAPTSTGTKNGTLTPAVAEEFPNKSGGANQVVVTGRGV